MKPPFTSRFFLVLALAFVASGCSEPEPVVPDTPSEPELAPEPAAEPEEIEEPEGPPPRLFTKRWVVTVRTAAHTTASRIGYLRSGSVVQGKSERTRTTDTPDEDCESGFLELDEASGGGFVCASQMIPFLGERLPERPGPQADREARLPYRYGYARRDMTPVYRRMPSDEQAAEHEGYVIPGTEPPPQEETAAAPAAATPSEAPQEAASVPAGLGGVDGQEAAAAPAPAAPAAEEAEEEVEEAPPPRLRELQYQRGILRRHLMRGFYVSLDRTTRTGRRRYWRTLQNTYVPQHWLGEREGSAFTGNVFGDDTFIAPVVYGEDGAPVVAAVPTEGETPPSEPTSLIGVAFSLRRGLGFYVDRNGRFSRGRTYPPRTAIPIMSRIENGGFNYLSGPDGHFLRERETYFFETPELPEGVEEGEKWIDVNLERQTLIAYEGTEPVFATLISSGIVLRPGVEEADHRTPTGSFRINAKHVTKTMDADNHLQGPYSVEDVPYVMYYEGNYALHTAFWHDSFGSPKSHGCVNMSPADSRWVFNWSEPQLPDGWHGIYPADEGAGTLVHIHGETPVGRGR